MENIIWVPKRKKKYFDQKNEDNKSKISINIMSL